MLVDWKIRVTYEFLNILTYSIQPRQNLIDKFTCDTMRCNDIELKSCISIFGFCGFFSFAKNQSTVSSYNSGFRDELFKLFYPRKFSMHSFILHFTLTIHALTYLYAPNQISDPFSFRQKINCEFSVMNNNFASVNVQVPPCLFSFSFWISLLNTYFSFVN